MPKLKLLRGSESWTELALGAESVLIGRDNRQCQVVLGEDTVSRRHAEIVREGEDYFVIDRASRAGTTVNNKRLRANEPHRLRSNDLIQICNFVLTFLDDSPVSEQPEAVVRVEQDEDSSGCSSVLESSSQSWVLRKSINPEAKLTAIMQLTHSLRGCRTLEHLLEEALDHLLTLYVEAERGVVLLTQSRHKPSVSCVVRQRAGRRRRTGGIVTGPTMASVLQKQVAIVSEDESMMCAPLVDAHNQSLGMIQLDARRRRGRFTTEDLDLLATIAVEISFAVENWILHEVDLRERQLHFELQVANEVQIGLLPSSPPRVDGYLFYDYYAPAKLVGGDYYDYLELENRRLAFVLGDVSGKGVPAALLMAKVSTEMSVHLASGLGPSATIERVNPRFQKQSPTGRFVTLVVAVLDLVTHEIALANAGHLLPLLRRRDGSVVEIGANRSGLPLGIDPLQQYAEVRFRLQEGEALVVFSDGVTEATNADGVVYGHDRLGAQIAGSSGNAEVIGAGIMRDLDKFVADQQQSDDICLVCVSRNEIGTEQTLGTPASQRETREIPDRI